MNKLTKETLKLSLDTLGLDELPQLWDGKSKFEKGIAKKATQFGFLYVIIGYKEELTDKVYVQQTFYPASYPSSNVEIYAVMPSSYNSRAVENNTKESKLTTEEQLIQNLIIPEFKNDNAKREWLKTNGFVGWHRVKSEEAFMRAIVETQYRLTYGVKMKREPSLTQE